MERSEPLQPAPSPCISAPASWDDVRNAFEDTQYLLDNHVAARRWVDECRHRLETSGVIGLANWTWATIDKIGGRPNAPHGIRDYRAGVRMASVKIRLGHEYAHVLHELVARDGYQLRAKGGLVPIAPVPAVASKGAAVLDGIDDWGKGPRANGESLRRWMRTRPRDRFKL